MERSYATDKEWNRYFIVEMMELSKIAKRADAVLAIFLREKIKKSIKLEKIYPIYITSKQRMLLSGRSLKGAYGLDD